MPNLFAVLFLASASLLQPARVPPPVHVIPDVEAELPLDPAVREARRLAAAKDGIREHVRVMYGGDCEGGFRLPEGAFMPIEITGVGTPELAVSLALAECGGSASAFTGTGGVRMQFWRIEDGRVTLLLDQSMHGFTPAAPYLVAFRHGSRCPGGAGPQHCRVVYRWDPLGERLETVDRHLMGEEGPIYDHGSLTGTGPPCSPENSPRCRR